MEKKKSSPLWLTAKWSTIAGFLIAWFGFIGPAMVSAESTLLSTGWFALTGVAALFGFVKLVAFLGRYINGTPMTTLAVGIAALAMVGCSKVPAGNVGVKVYLLGGKKGVESEVLGTGRYWIGWNEDLYLFPTFQQNYTWSGDQEFIFQTKKGMKIGTDVGMTYHVVRDSVSRLFQKYRRGVDEIRDQVVRRHIQDALNAFGSKMEVDEAYGVGKVALFDSVQARVYKNLASDGIVVERIFMVGEFRLPQQVIDALNAAVKQTQDAQRAENKLRADSATAKSKIILANAEAYAIKVKAAEVTPVMVEWEKAKRWDGKLPATMTGSGTFLMLNNK